MTTLFGASDPVELVITTPGDEILLGRGFVTHFTVILDHGHRLIVQP